MISTNNTTLYVSDIKNSRLQKAWYHKLITLTSCIYQQRQNVIVLSTTVVYKQWNIIYLQY